MCVLYLQAHEGKLDADAAATSSTELAPADPFQLTLLYDFAQRKVHWLWLSLATVSIYYYYIPSLFNP